MWRVGKSLASRGIAWMAPIGIALRLREEALGDAALVEARSIVRACSPPARDPASSWLARRSTTTASDACQRELRLPA